MNDLVIPLKKKKKATQDREANSTKLPNFEGTSLSNLAYYATKQNKTKKPLSP